ncbi:DNA mismatch repair protein MutH [Alteromonas sp. KC3]|uniref:DNA mismatch repair endonuclease MutH n=1 Tax=unclassified Alteromonas TaxID=2614992 RepID=UPI001920585A|nr:MULTISPECIES: DNA mismatch repair endonuclease MutH [unclassified Alteromonas]BCO17682.1 DNA mismatch repair protein MutH [Alteromonas sp. KC3]BCO21643.1 DNA mismatch repair protein MutH [Alteromonas sp. KC14]
MQPPVSPPTSPDDLLARCHAIAGLTLGELADMANVAIPANLQRHKGWPGMLIEKWLGASAGSKPQQDFPELGIELKTIPIDGQFAPLETTYVCFAPLLMTPGITWETSNVRNKLQQVLWLPVEGARHIPLAERRVATGFYWRPSEEEDQLLKDDWEELTEQIITGNVESITSRQGNALHIRPKAANGKVLTDALNPDGERIKTRPRGFYLRKTFTHRIMMNAFFA